MCRRRSNTGNISARFVRLDGRIWFYTKEDDEEFVAEHFEQLVTDEFERHPGYPHVFLPTEGKPFDDVFLFVSLSCLSGQKLIPQMHDLGVDVAIGFESLSCGSEHREFVKLFVEYSRKGKSIKEAADEAATGASNEAASKRRGQRLEETLIICPKNGASEQRLLPARYGGSAE